MIDQSPSKRPNNIVRGLLLFLASALITTVGWASSGRHSDYAEPQQDNLRIPTMPSDMEDRIRAAMDAPPLAVGQLSDPFERPAADTGGPAAASRPARPLAPTFTERYEFWRTSVLQARQAGRPDPPVTSAYLAEELQPIGVTRAHGQTKVLFHVSPEKRDIAVVVGTRFYDCTLAAIEDRGVRLESGSKFRILEWASASGPADLAASSPPAAKSPTPKDPLQQLQEAAPDHSTRPRSITKQPPDAALAPSVPSIPPGPKLLLASYSSISQRLVPSFAVYHSDTKASRLMTVVADRSDSDGDTRRSTKKMDSQPAPDEQPSTGPSGSRPRVVGSGDNKDDARPAAGQSTQSEIARMAAPVQTTGQSTTGAFPGPTIPADSERVRAENFCNPSYEGPPASIDTTRPTTLVTLTELYYKEFGVNFLVDPEVQELPIRASIYDVPWTAILRNIIEVNDLVATCQGNIITIMGRGKFAKLLSEKQKSQPIHQKVFTLRYLQPNPSSIRSITGQQVPENFGLQTLEESIRKILKASGDDRGDVTRVPGRNELIVAGTDDQLAQVTQLIDRVDRPTYQIEVHALIYSIDKNYLKDVGSQLGVLAANGSQSNLGGVSTLPSTSGTAGTGGAGSTKGGTQPGGIPTLATGLPQPSPALGAANAAAILGYTAIVGTSQFSHFITLAQQKGWATIVNKPFGTVADGSPLELSAGSDIPVVTSVIAGGATVQTGNVQVLQAGKVLQITPQVAQDRDGKATGVTLTVRIESNSVDTSLPAFGGLPSIARQSLQTVIRLTDGQTGVIGGLAADSTSKTVNSVPLLGNVPILGHLFKRTADQKDNGRLYFAITARIIPMGGSLNNVSVPADATTELPSGEGAREMTKKNEH